MARTLPVLLGAMMLITTPFGDAAAGTSSPEEPREYEELLVIRRGGSPAAGLRAAFEKLGVIEIDSNPKLRSHRLRVPAESRDRILRTLERRFEVLVVEDNESFTTESVPNDPQFGIQWHLPVIQAQIAWEFVPPSSSVVIAILDTGVDEDHPDLVEQLVSGINTYDGGSTDDVHGHGTKVAGAAGAAAFNEEGVASVAWNARIMPIRVTGPDGTAFSSTLADGLVWAADNGARIANMSFQSVAGSATIRAAAQYFVQRGGIVFAGAGNLAEEEPIDDTPWIISVSGTDQTDSLASFSSWGDYVDLSAPGKTIRTTKLGGGYGKGTGTSFAGPVAAGVAALVLSVDPSFTPGQVEELLETTANDLGDAGWDPQYGYGRVNAGLAVFAASEIASGVAPQCSDGMDNDGNGAIDYPDDAKCLTAGDPFEVDPACGLGFELAVLLPFFWRRLRRAQARPISSTL